MPTLELSRQLEPKAGAGCTTLTDTLESPMSGKLSATAVLALESKPTTLKGKSSGCKQSTRKRKLSETLGAGLTSNAKVCVPYWDEFCAETSSKLWLPIETGLQDLGSTYSVTSLSKMVENSWFSAKALQPKKKSFAMTFSPYSTTLAVECTAKEVIRARKIRLYPTNEQEKLFRNWLAVSRYSYNRTVDLIQSGWKAEWKSGYKFLCKFFPDDMKSIPFQVKKIAVKEAYTSLFAGIKRSEKFRLHYRTRKDRVQSCFIPASAISDKGLYYTISGVLKMSEYLPNNVRDSRLVLDHGRWFLTCSYSKTTVHSDSQGRIVALDPGVRTFLTGFHEQGAFKIGSGAQSRIFRLCLFADKLISKISKSDPKRKRNMRKALDRMYWKIKDLITELHFKSAAYLCENFDVILLPTFEVSDMVVKSKRKIRSKTVRQMLTLSHYKFEQRIKSKAEETGKLVQLCNEAYTSKTASWTGEIKQIGGSKTITSGGVTLDRDVNGGRGIFLRSLVDIPWLREIATCTRCN